MARPYTADLRERVLLACERGGLSRSRIADLFGVGESTLYRWRQAWRTEGRREAKPHRGGPAPRLDAAALDRLKELVAASNDRTLAEYAAGLGERAGVAASGPTVCRALRKLGLTRKKDAAGRGAGPARAGRGPDRVAGRAGADRAAAARLPR
jgi:transposase